MYLSAGVALIMNDNNVVADDKDEQPYIGSSNLTFIGEYGQ